VKQRSHATDVVARIEALRGRFDVIEYGRVAYGGEAYPLLALASPGWRRERPLLLVTGGVHGYETSGVHGALAFAEREAARFSGEADWLVVPCVSPWATSASSVGTPRPWTPTAVSASPARPRSRRH
jgi:hypothetical protein